MTSLTTNTLTFDSGSLGYNDIAKNMAGESTMIISASDHILEFPSLQVGQTVYGGGSAPGRVSFTIKLTPSGSYKIARWSNGYDNTDSWAVYTLYESPGGSLNTDNVSYAETHQSLFIITRIS